MQKEKKAALSAALTVFCIGIFLALLGGFLTKANPYNSYALEAMRWLEGHLDLGQNYAHLEIAEYGGRFFVSFPPLPALALLPLVPFFGTNTPDALLSIVFAAAGAYAASRLASSYGKKPEGAFFWSLYVTIGGNLLSLMCTGWVWFLAQTMAFSLLLFALYAAKCGKTAAALFFAACAAGCRPFSVLIVPVLFYLLHTHGQRFSKKTFLRFLPAALLALFYATLNFLRFGNPLEFGHTYLPEFQAEPQFGLSYILENAKTLFRLPAMENGKIVFPAFNGFAFFLASPLFLTYARAFLLQKKKGKDYMVLTLFLLWLLLFCMHRTMGGWHFGHRYTVDILPLAFLGTMELGTRARGTTVILCFLGMILHVYGFFAQYAV